MNPILHHREACVNDARGQGRPNHWLVRLVVGHRCNGLIFAPFGLCNPLGSTVGCKVVAA
jgi:hypothetical protein